MELSSPKFEKALAPAARRNGKQVILSYHNFKSTPPDRLLEGYLKKGKRAGADLVKIAVTPKKSSEVTRLLRFTERHRGDRIVIIGMGRIGAPTRILAPLRGSLLTYTFIGRPQALGQLGLAATGRLFRLARASRSGQLSLRRLAEELKRFSRFTARPSA